MLMFYLTRYLRVEFIIWHKIKIFCVWTCSFNYRGHIYVLRILCVTYTYMTSKSLKDITVSRSSFFISLREHRIILPKWQKTWEKTCYYWVSDVQYSNSGGRDEQIPEWLMEQLTKLTTVKLGSVCAWDPPPWSKGVKWWVPWRLSPLYWSPEPAGS